MDMGKERAFIADCLKAGKGTPRSSGALSSLELLSALIILCAMLLCRIV